MVDQSKRLAARREVIATDANGNVAFASVDGASGNPTLNPTGGGTVTSSFTTPRGFRLSRLSLSLTHTGTNGVTITVSRNGSQVAQTAASTSVGITQTNTPATSGVQVFTVIMGATAGTATGTITQLSRNSRTVI